MRSARGAEKPSMASNNTTGEYSNASFALQVPSRLNLASHKAIYLSKCPVRSGRDPWHGRSFRPGKMTSALQLLSCALHATGDVLNFILTRATGDRGAKAYYRRNVSTLVSKRHSTCSMYLRGKDRLPILRQSWSKSNGRSCL